MQRPSNQWLEVSWPSVAICAVFAGIILAASLSNRTFDSTIGALIDAPFWHRKAENQPDRVLVVVSNPERRSQVILTLTPRGLEPVLASNLSEVRKELAANPALPRLAVVDGAVRNSDRIARTLAVSMPASRIVVLNQFDRREAIGKILLDRL